MKTITFKTRLIGKALFSFNPATQELWWRQDKNARLDREECAGFPGFDYQALSILDSILSLAQTQPQLVQYPPEKKTKLPCMRVCHTTKQLQKRPGKFQHTTCFLFLPGINAAAACPCGSLQGVGPTASAEDGGEGGGQHPGDHHTNRGRQRHSPISGWHGNGQTREHDTDCPHS